MITLELVWTLKVSFKRYNAEELRAEIDKVDDYFLLTNFSYFYFLHYKFDKNLNILIIDFTKFPIINETEFFYRK